MCDDKKRRIDSAPCGLEVHSGWCGLFEGPSLGEAPGPSDHCSHTQEIITPNVLFEPERLHVFSKEEEEEEEDGGVAEREEDDEHDVDREEHIKD